MSEGNAEDVRSGTPGPPARESKAHAYDPPAYEHLHQHGRRASTHLLESHPDDIPGFDVAEMNLICAYGLPGTEDMDIAAMLRLLDSWAKRVWVFTRQHMSLYESGQSGFNSLAEFRIASMLHVVTKEFRVSYNPERLDDPDNFDDPADSFIHGILGPRRMGTCASLPVLFTAIGRRLRYPLYLVEAPGHLFYRWDTLEGRFNIEFHEQGLNIHPVEHYRQWPFPWPSELIEREAHTPTYLISLTAQQELALCAGMRAQFLGDMPARRTEAARTMRIAYNLWPAHRYGVWLNHLLTKARFPDRDFPRLPCEETAGVAVLRQAAAQGLLEPGAAIPPQ